MAWGSTENSPPEARVSVSKEAFVSVLRDEYIPVGYNLTEEVTDLDTGVVSKVTTFHQTATVNVRCRIKTTVTTMEERGLKKDAAEGHSWFNDVSDNRTYGKWTVGMCFVEVPNCIGTVVRVAAHRSNEADGWTVTKTTTVTAKA